MLTLKDIVEREPRVLLDTSGMPIRTKGNNGSKSMVIIEKIDDFINFLKTVDNVYTIPECVEEIQPVKRKAKKESKRMKKLSYEGERTFRQLKENVKRLTSALKRKTLYLEGVPAYGILRDIVFQLEDSEKIKGRLRESIEEKRSKIDERRTDEKLIATALFYTIYSRTGTAVISNDSDFRALLFTFYNALNSPLFKPENGLVINGLKNRGIKLYGQIGDEYKVFFDTTKYKPKRLQLPKETLGEIKRTLQRDLTSIVA